MIIKLNKQIDFHEINRITTYIEGKSLTTELIQGEHYLTLNIIGDTTHLDHRFFYAFKDVLEVLRIQEPYTKVQSQEERDIPLPNYTITQDTFTLIAGPCAVEDEASLKRAAAFLEQHGIKIMRAGAFKPRTSPYSFQGHELEGLELLSRVAKEYNLSVISEITDLSQLDAFLKYVDIIQVGARNMQNFPLLKALAKVKKPVLIKRGFGNTIDELLMSAEYLLAGGNTQVILCERGIRSFDNAYLRNSLDVGGIAMLKKLTNLPIFADPSHAAGRWDLVTDLALAGVAAGATGLIVEIHEDPLKALSDGAQALKFDKFLELQKKAQEIFHIVRNKNTNS